MGFSSSSSFPFDTFSSLNPSPSPLSFEVRDSTANTVGAETLAAAEATTLTQLPISVTESYGLPQPLERLQGDPIPPFLSKTFALVDDPSLDPIISWASAGESFVIWEPMEFARLVLPRNFKHNNFSSFVRQLNTYFYAYAYEARTAIILQGFRKTDTDKWEFSNGCFVRGKKHLLKNIHRRRSTTQSRQLSSCGRGSTSVESAKSSLGTVVENLKKEKCVLMQEVEGLQQENRGTACRVEVVKQRLQEAEQRHKQMISFIANVFQNPAFVERLCQMKAHRELSLPRTRRKLLERKQGEGGGSSGSAEGQIVKFGPESSNRTASEIRKPELSSSKYLSQDVVGNFSAEMDSPLRELAAVQELRDVPEQLGDGASILEPGEHFLKGNGILSPQMEVASPDYFMALPEDLAMGKGFLECPSPGTENLVLREEERLSMDFDGTAAVAASETEFWDNITNGDFPGIGPSCSDGLSDIWGLGSLPAAGDILE